MDEKTECLVVGSLSGLTLVIWGLVMMFLSGFSLVPIGLIFVGVVIIIFSVVVVKYGDR